MDMQQMFVGRMSRLGTESAFEVLKKANELEAQGKEVVHLEIGQPDFATPDNIIEAAYRAMKNGCTGYTTTQGIPELRQAIAEYYTAERNVPASADEVVVVPGGKPIMFFTMLALVEPGDEVLYPDPGFPIYESCIRFAGGIPVPMPILQENGFKVDVEQMKRQVSEKTKLIILNSPGNPTGGVLDKEDVEAIAQVVRTTNAMVMSDEIYDRLIFTDQKPFSIASIPDMKERTIILNGFSKTYAMTGWRLGYAAGPREIISLLPKLHEFMPSCVPEFLQLGAAEALEHGEGDIAAMHREYSKRRAILLDWINGIHGLSCRAPGGAFYAFLNIQQTGLSSVEFAERLLSEQGVVAAPGDAFGAHGEGFIRISYATSIANIKKAMDRMEAFVGALLS